MAQGKEVLYVTGDEACLLYDCVETVLTASKNTDISTLKLFVAVKEKLLNLKSVAAGLKEAHKKLEVAK